MMGRARTSVIPRWAAGVLAGVVAVSWIMLLTVWVPPARAATDASLPGSGAPGVAPAAAAGIASAEPNRVTGVELSGVGPMSATVVVKTDLPVESYDSFLLPDPPRLVIDIPNAVHAAPKALEAQGPITGIRTSQYKTTPVKVVRIVLDLSSTLPYQVQAAPDRLQVLIGEAAAEAPTVAAPPKTGETPTQAPAPLPAAAIQTQVESVDYRPHDGQPEIFIRTSGGRVTVNVSEVSTPPGLILDVSGAVISPEAAKILDVRQVPGPVERIRAAQHRLEPDKVVRIVADLKGKVLFDVSQAPDGIHLALKTAPAVAAAPAAPAGPQPQEKPIVPVAPPAAAPPPPEARTPKPVLKKEVPRLSMDFKDADINNLLRIIAEVSGQNIVSGEQVKGKVTVRLVDVPWDVALDNILRINGFGFVREANIIRVAKLDEIRKEQESRRKEQQLIEEGSLEPLTTAVLKVNYADPKAVVQNLTKVQSKRGSISVDERTASLLVRDTASNIAQMRKILEDLDRATAQVMIEGRIVTVSTRHSRSLGIQWGFQKSNTSADPGSKFIVSDIFGTTGAGLPQPSEPTGPINGSIPAAVNLPVAGPAGAIGIIFGSVADQLRFNASLTALENQSLARTLSTPRIVALDNQEAEIKQGEDVPFTTVDSSGRTTVTFEEAVLSLKVTPHVTNDRRISLKVRATDDSRGERIDFAGGFAFPFNRNEATSSLLIDNGATVVIGGVRKRTETITEERVPFLGTIPVLGWLFKRRSETLQPDTTELLIFVTPTIIEGVPQAQR